MQYYLKVAPKLYYVMPGCVGCVIGGIVGGVGVGGLLTGSKSQPPSQLLIFLSGCPSLSKITKQSCGTTVNK